MASGQYFDADPAVASRPSRVTLTLHDMSLDLSVDRGVFSAGRIDPGTVALLRAERQAPAQGDMLDLGCGYGPLAAALATRAPGATIWAVDVNRRAVELTAANAAELGLDNIRACVPEDVPAEVQFTALWSNPPIRVGKVALHDLLRTWLGRLRPDGVAHLVVHKHLGGDSLAAWLQAEGWAVQRTGSKQGYRLLRVAPASPPVGDGP